VLAIACVVSVAAWVYLVAGHGGFWLTGQRLPVGAGAGHAAWPAVAAVVPARNEAESLPVTLPALLAQDYPGEFRVFLVDDNSDDGTGEIAAELGEKAARAGGAPLTVVQGRPRPDGWAGKVWAMAQGLAEATGRDAADAGEAPDYILFTDADIASAPHALRDLVRGAQAGDRALVSQMAMLRAETRWERVIVPAFVYFFAQLFPFRKVNAPRSKTAAAAGGCMLARRAALAAAGGLEPIKGALIDDVALGTLLKRSGNRIWLGLTTDIRSTRPYPSLASLWHMIARSAYVQLRYNPLLLAGTLAGLLLLYVVPPAGAVAALAVAAAGGAGPLTALTGAAGLAGWALMTASYVPMLRLYRLSPLRAPGLPLIAVLYAAMTADSARRHYSGRAVSWRGRTADRV
jgi:hopene-associated glycosyltransferase HpnB